MPKELVTSRDKEAPLTADPNHGATPKCHSLLSPSSETPQYPSSIHPPFSGHGYLTDSNILLNLLEVASRLRVLSLYPQSSHAKQPPLLTTHQPQLPALPHSTRHCRTPTYQSLASETPPIKKLTPSHMTPQRSPHSVSAI